MEAVAIKKLYTVADVARMFDAHRSGINKLIDDGRVTGLVRPGRAFLIQEGAEILPAGNLYHGSKISRYVAECRERGVPATIPPPWWGDGEEDRA